MLNMSTCRINVIVFKCNGHGFWFCELESACAMVNAEDEELDMLATRATNRKNEKKLCKFF
jgi:hypothetical protein